MALSPASVTVTAAPWGTASSVGSACQLYCIESRRLRLFVSDFGATVQRVQALVKGAFVDIASGFDTVEAYEGPANRYFGATVGRYGNRIAGGRFSFATEASGGDGSNGGMRTVVQLAVNNGPNALHGGTVGFNRRMFAAEVVGTQTATEGHGGQAAAHVVGVRFTRISEDGEEGYPSAVRVVVTIGIGIDVTGASLDDVVMQFDVENIGVSPTPINVINHNYWNLNGACSGQQLSSGGIGKATLPTAMDHVLHLPNAPWYTPVDETSIPTGEIRAVKGSPFDFCSAPKPIGRDIAMLDDTPQKGYDHNLVIRHRASLVSAFGRARFYETLVTQASCAGAATPLSTVVGFVGTLSSPSSGLSAAVFTTFPGLQVYTGNFLPTEAGMLKGLGGAPITHRSTVCLEAQYFPDAPNHSHFPSAVVQPGERRVDWQVYRFTIPE